MTGSWSVFGGQWSVVSGQLSVVSCLWSVVRDQLSVVGVRVVPSPKGTNSIAGGNAPGSGKDFSDPERVGPPSSGQHNCDPYSVLQIETSLTGGVAPGYCLRPLRVQDD